MEITVLCKVVDNYGDIGVTWRMSKQLVIQNPLLKINYVIDDLVSFAKIESKIDPVKDFQTVDNIEIFDWKADDFCHRVFSEKDGEKLSLILECFQCGRPEWMDRILFEEKLNRTVDIIMIDYLTAEDYAEDFHKLKSLTRSAKVRKVNFMPGFTAKTGGLIIDEQWKKLEARNKDGDILVFTYERDWQPLVKAIGSWDSRKRIKVAQGRGLESFVESYKKSSAGNELIVLDYLDQQAWDEMMKDCSVLFIRGEESMSRACLSGIPFVWHAYPQSDEYQLVKVKALLGKLEPYFSAEQYEVIKQCWLDFNSPENEVDGEEMKNNCLKFLKTSDNLAEGFYKFASDLRKNGDLCTNLMTFIEEIAIIK